MKEVRERQEVWPFILLSLVLHVLLMFLIYRTASVPKFTEKSIEVIPLFEDVKKHRIADIDKPDVEKKPDHPDFLGRYDSSVKKPQVADGRVSKGGEGKKGQKGEEKKRKKTVKKKKKTSDKMVAKKKAKPSTSKKGSRLGGMGSPGGDYFPDFKRGNKTYLNVLRYPAVDYFVRMKRAFRVTFNPTPSLRDHFMANRVYQGSVNVVLGVSVDRSGNLSELFIFRSSGINGYDQEALRTIKASSPFSSPPKKFVESDGILRMSWTFTVYM
ncbi:MAG: TonB family protein [Deltaproteobacteria bacterium]|jgi:TonB family protein|nr:TonB family protein [Deltaproteobacteria bacterium]